MTVRKYKQSDGRWVEANDSEEYLQKVQNGKITQTNEYIEVTNSRNEANVNDGHVHYTQSKEDLETPVALKEDGRHVWQRQDEGVPTQEEVESFYSTRNHAQPTQDDETISKETASEGSRQNADQSYSENVESRDVQSPLSNGQDNMKSGDERTTQENSQSSGQDALHGEEHGDSQASTESASQDCGQSSSADTANEPTSQSQSDGQSQSQ